MSANTSRKAVFGGLLITLLASVALGGGCGKSETRVNRQPGDGAECTMDSECPDGSLCHGSGVCVEECSIDDDCASDETCDAGRCVRQNTKDCEYPCPANMGCVGGQCLWQCKLNVDCPAKYECKAGYCQTGGCSEHADCAKGQGCFEGSCLEAACRENSECPEKSVCSLGECKELGACVSDAHCGGDIACVNGECESTGSGGAGSDEPGSGRTCEINRDCGSRQYCIQDKCRLSTECISHAHCPAGEGCFRNQCWEL